MKIWFLLCLFSWQVWAGEEATFGSQGGWLQYATPEEAGFSSKTLDEAYAMAQAGNTAAFMLVYRGKVLAAWGRVADRYKLHSVRKSLYSALYGIYVREGKIDLNKTVAELGIDDIHGLTEAERRATVRDLISARSGIYHPAAKEPPDMKRSRPERGKHGPGEHFYYNNWDFNTSAMILEQETGVELFEMFTKRLAEPLGFQDYRPIDGFHEYDRAASKYPAHAFRMSTRDMARFGQLYLQKGVWKGRRMLDEDWIKASTAPVSPSNWHAYGYMWWVMEEGSVAQYPELDAYMASGTGGQKILVCEDTQMVMVHRGDTDRQRHVRTREIMALFFKILEGKTGEPKAEPKLVPMSPRPLDGVLPALADRQFIQLPPGELAKYKGGFAMPDGVVIRMRAMDDRLVGSHPFLGEMDFFPVSKNHFASANTNIEVWVQLNEKGLPDQAEISLFGQKVTCKRVE